MSPKNTDPIPDSQKPISNSGKSPEFQIQIQGLLQKIARYVAFSEAEKRQQKALYQPKGCQHKVRCQPKPYVIRQSLLLQKIFFKYSWNGAKNNLGKM